MLLTALAAILGMIPLARSIFWGPMAITIMGGLFMATVLTLLVVPVLYAMWFRVRAEESLDTSVKRPRLRDQKWQGPNTHPYHSVIAGAVENCAVVRLWSVADVTRPVELVPECICRNTTLLTISASRSLGAEPANVTQSEDVLVTAL